MRLHQRWPHLLSPAKYRADRVIKRSSIPILLHYIIWSAQSMGCRQYRLMSTCQGGINDDDWGKKSSTRRPISIIRNFEAQWRPNWDVRLRAKPQAHWDATSARRLHRRYSGSPKRCLPVRTAVSNRNWRYILATYCPYACHSRWNWS